MAKNQKIIVIGLDGGSWTVLAPLIDGGKLPAFKKIMQKGAYGTLLSCVPCRSGAGIPTFYTGKNPAKWGMFDFPCCDPDVVNYKKIKERTQSVWDILEDSGRKSAIFNIPTVHPPVPIKASPESIQKKYEQIRDVIRDPALDFSIFWIDESDAVQHESWGKEEFILPIYQAIDDILGDITENNPDSDIFIVSDHGAAVAPSHEFYPKTWLEKEGYLKLKGLWPFRWLIKIANTFLVSSPHYNRYKRLEHIYFAYNKVNKMKNSKSPKFIGIDWAKTTAVNHDFWGIRIIKENLRQDYEQIRSEIMEKMKRLKDKNGENIIKDVWKKEELFKGPDFDKFPDIVYLSKSKFQATGFLPFCITRKKSKPPKLPGDHLTSREGIFIASGPGIKNTGKIGKINITDIAPTILKVLNAPASEDMDGRVLYEILAL